MNVLLARQSVQLRGDLYTRMLVKFFAGKVVGKLTKLYKGISIFLAERNPATFPTLARVGNGYVFHTSVKIGLNL